MNRIKLAIIFLLTVGVLSMLNAAKADVAYNNMDDTFTTIVKGDNLQKIETWKQPVTEYTPKNLRSQYQIRFSGKDGSNKVTSYTLPVTDYDTYINAISKDEATGKMYVHDNAGRKILTGIDNSAQIEQLRNDNSAKVKDVQNRVDNLSSRVQSQQNQINKLDNKLEGGLATVTALTGLHPNPRATEKLEVSFSTGIYADNVAGAMGLFYHPNDRVQLNVGASYGGDSQFAGSCGITFSIGRRN